MNEHQQFVDWFRHASPYIHAHRGDTFVISFAGEAVESPGFTHIVHDAALLSSLGIRVVLVHGTRPQIERTMERLGMEARYAQNIRITDEEALEAVKSTCGQVSADIQALLSMGLADSPLSDARISVSMGNFIMAKPVGVRDGIDFMRTGEVRRIDGDAINRRLEDGNIVLVSPLGYSPTGEIFNLALEDVAAQVAIALKSEKWVSLSEVPCPRDADGNLASQMTVEEAKKFFATQDDEDTRRQIRNAIRACEQGVHRVQLVERDIDGGILLELFTRDGVGTLVSHNAFE
ncbi:MAG: amino-acid N-acetyltransferase, partial [Pseudomonadota bacterium]